MSKLLDEYRRKRSADRTPEPMGAGAARPGVFVVQKHSATRMHYDLRLEWDGVLKSWAVPRGPHPDPAENRLAMQTEDHPVEYADFEGVIPEGEYGAGPMIVWDRGLWRPLGDPGEGVKAGKLLFELKGFKLKGMWTLVRIKGETGKEWLLIKETGDGHVRRGAGFPWDDSSILSGLEVEELRDRGSRAAKIRSELLRLDAPRREVRGEDVQPMLAEPRRDPFDDPEWLFELKYDGFRAIAAREGSRPRIFYRRGSDATARSSPALASWASKAWWPSGRSPPTAPGASATGRRSASIAPATSRWWASPKAKDRAAASDRCTSPCTTAGAWSTSARSAAA